MPVDPLRRLSESAPKLKGFFKKIAIPMYQVPPYSLGPPSERAQSTYYPGPSILTKDEIADVSRVLEELNIYPENTRLRKFDDTIDGVAFEILQASVQQDATRVELTVPSSTVNVRLVRGDHAQALGEICSHMSEAAKYAANENQRLFLLQCVESFQTGSLETYRESQRTWLKDKSPRIESIFGFVEPYRDPYGSRAEFEGLVGINDLEETSALRKLVEKSDTFIKRLPWAGEGQTENDGKGPFERALFDPPDLSSLYSKFQNTHSHWPIGL